MVLYKIRIQDMVIKTIYKSLSRDKIKEGIIIGMAVLPLFFGGCHMENKQTVKAVVIGMENSHKYGSCPGAEFDANNMNFILSRADIPTTKILNSKKNDAIRAMTEAVQSDLAIIYYSGHGGSQRFSDTGPDETDGKDEFLCMDDGLIRDNEIWNIICQARGRVFLVFDCCHSETMFRSAGFTMNMVSDVALPLGADGPVGMICWSGCADNTYSYGSSSGGELTNCIRRHLNKDSTYASLWDAVSKDAVLKQHEIVKKHTLGIQFEEKRIFE